MKTIFVDMDGVLTNFDKRYQDLFGILPKEARHLERGTFGRHWNTFIESNQFATLEKFPGADELVEALNKQTKARVAILSSSGGFDNQNKVMSQKINWLRDQKIDWPVCIVPGRRFKSGYADSYSLLIDDTLDNVTSFREAGGQAVQYKSDAKWEAHYAIESFIK